MIRVKCPKCEKVLGLDDSKAGAPALCPACKQKFMVPGTPAKAPAGAAKPGDKPKDESWKKPGTEDDDFTPYTIKDEGPAKQVDDRHVDDMIRFEGLKRKRDRAWKEVGLPAKLIKILALSAIGALLLCFLYLSVVTALFLHQQKLGNLEARPLLLVADVKGEDYDAVMVWLISLGVWVVLLTIQGFILSGAEKMKKLESWGMSLTAAILTILFGTVFGLAFGFWAISVLMNKDVKLEFEKAARTRARQAAGLDPEDEEEEADEDEEEDEDEDEDDEEEDEDDED